MFGTSSQTTQIINRYCNSIVHCTGTVYINYYSVITLRVYTLDNIQAMNCINYRNVVPNMKYSAYIEILNVHFMLQIVNVTLSQLETGFDYLP